MEMKVLLFIGGLIALCVGDDIDDADNIDDKLRCACYVDHPQQMFCDADYAFVGTVMSTKDLTPLFRYNVSISGDSIYEGRDYFEKGKTIVSVYTPYGTSLCGRPYLEIGKEYLITGVYFEEKLMMTFCNWVEPWEDVTFQQKSFLKNKNYLDHCHSCQVIGVKQALTADMKLNDKDGASPDQISGLWTPDGCYFNPVASANYRHVDCESAYTYCYPVKAGKCKWRMTMEYKECFPKREGAWERVKSGQNAAAFRDFTRVKDCKKLATRRMKKNCLKMVKNMIKNKKEDLEPRAMLEELLDLRDLWLEIEDDDDDLLFD